MGSTNKHSLLTYLDELMGDLHESIPKALKEFSEDGIHDARVATRRLTAALRLLEPILSDDHRRAFQKVLKKLRRRLGPMRDFDVMIDRLGKLRPHPSLGTATGWLIDKLEIRRQEERKSSGDKSKSADILAKLGPWWHVREEIEEAHEAVDCLLAESLHLQLDAFSERAEGLAEKVSNGKNDAQHDPHEVRIAGKLLRYTLELADAQGHALPAAILRNFKRLQQSLGDWHDNVVLVERAMQLSVDCMVSYHDISLQEQLLNLSRYFLRRAEHDLGSFIKLWQDRGAQIAAAIRQQFPLTSPVTESQMDPDRGDSDGKADPAKASAGVPANA